MRKRKSTMPLLRFPEFRKPWRKVAIKDICWSKSSNKLAKHFGSDYHLYEPGIYPVFNANQQITSISVYDADVPYISIIRDGTGVGRVDLRPAYSSVISTMNYLFNKNSNLEFLYYILQNKINWQNYFTGSTIPHLYFRDFAEHKLYVPCLAEQERISGLLASVEQLIAQSTRLKNHYTQLKKAILQRTMALNQEQPQLRLAEFTASWQEQELQDIFDKLTNGKRKTLAQLHEQQSAHAPYPVYSAQTLRQGIMGYYHEHLFEDCITWTREGYAGQFNYRSGKFYCIDTCGVLVSHKGYSNKFFAELLNLVAYKHVIQTSIPKLYADVLGRVKVTYPLELAEQLKLGNLYTCFDQKINQVEKQIQTFTSLKALLLQQLFV